MNMRILRNVLLALTLAFTTQVLAANGAVKTDLLDIQSNAVVGWAILNTTANGQLQATVQLSHGQPVTTYHMCVHVLLPSGEEACVMVGDLVTNGQGIGTAHGTRSIPDGISEVQAGVHLGIVMHEHLFETALVDLALK